MVAVLACWQICRQACEASLFLVVELERAAVGSPADALRGRRDQGFAVSHARV